MNAIDVDQGRFGASKGIARSLSIIYCKVDCGWVISWSKWRLIIDVPTRPGDRQLKAALRYPLTIILGTDATVRLLRELSGHVAACFFLHCLQTVAGLQGQALVCSRNLGRDGIIFRGDGQGSPQEGLRYSNIRAAIADVVSAVRPNVLAVEVFRLVRPPISRGTRPSNEEHL
ncbi:hypothetical protein [Mesorhizobium sp. M0011]|uniref:hypothetical protein n=1 Tax=Mesorhizobium sp. M0011 TaxID=2956839 RepID=UPI003336EE8A